MPENPLEDATLFAVTLPDDLLEGIRRAASGGNVEDRVSYLLNRCGLLAPDGELTEAGRALFKLTWVLRKTDDAIAALGQALRVLIPVQVIEQELRGLGGVPEDGVMELLRHHRAIGPDTGAQQLRAVFRWLNTAGVLVYSMKTKTVRSLAPAPEAALAGEIAAIASMVSPRTPYLNVVRLRRVLRQLRGTVWWVDAHFGARALEELAEEVEPNRVTEIRVLSGDSETVLTERSFKDFQRFRTELSAKGIHAEWRIDARSARDWHDRWIADNQGAWNVPPVNTLFRNDYSEIFPATERPPLSEWWVRSSIRSS